MSFEKFFDLVTQYALPFFTLGSVLLVSLKLPAWGLLSNLIAQPFWLYSTYRGWKTAGQWGMFVNTIAYTAITAFGVVNYFLLS